MTRREKFVTKARTSQLLRVRFSDVTIEYSRGGGFYADRLSQSGDADTQTTSRVF